MMITAGLIYRNRGEKHGQHLVGSLGEAVKWWIGTKMEMPPEDVADNYLKLTGYNE